MCMGHQPVLNTHTIPLNTTNQNIYIYLNESIEDNLLLKYMSNILPVSLQREHVGRSYSASRCTPRTDNACCICHAFVLLSWSASSVGVSKQLKIAVGLTGVHWSAFSNQICSSSLSHYLLRCNYRLKSETPAITPQKRKACAPFLQSALDDHLTLRPVRKSRVWKKMSRRRSSNRMFNHLIGV